MGESSTSAAASGGSAASTRRATPGRTSSSGGATDASAAPGGSAGTLTIWADDLYGPAIKTASAQFATDNGVTVNVETVSKDLRRSSSPLRRPVPVLIW
jgi:maltose-binding protein MalE